MRAMPTWPGGYVRTDRNGRPVYVIRRQWRGRRYVASTGRSTLAAAMAELARWERDPDTYDPRGDAAQAVRLTADRCAEYLTWARDVRGSGARWLLQVKAFLLWWVEELRGVDLRTMTPARVEQSLARAPTSRPHRIQAIRAVVGWYRRQGYLEVDPLAGRLPVPQAKPAQWRKPRTVSRADWRKVTLACTEPWRSCMTLLGATGWHLSELDRFAREGTIEGDVLGVLHKSGQPHRTRVPRRLVPVAQRVRALGGVRADSIDHAVGKVADRLGVQVRPGAARHCVATWAVEKGATFEEVAAFLGHRSPRTTKRAYATHAVPKRPRGM